MITWGISANSHDAALAVFCDEKLVFASHSERFSRKKNDKHLCKSLLNYAIDNYGLPDRVYWYENPYLKTIRQLYAGQGWKWRDNDIKRYLKQYGITVPITYTSHHLSHASAGYYTSPFSNACVVVIDAIGEFDTTTIWDANGHNLKKVYNQSFPNSVGLWYSAMTQRVGLKPLEDEYILMGMSAYGDCSLTSRVETDFIKNLDKLTFKKNLHRGCLDWAPELTIKDSFEIATATQQVYEHLLESILHKALSLSKSKNLVLMGGCALNCSANRLLGKFFDNIWIMPNPGDAGSSIGTVLAHNPNWRDYTNWRNPFLGFNITPVTNNDTIVDYLIENKICGLARGRAEFGPRALGNRSLLADPRGPDIKDKVNAIKQRQDFRPFAPAVLEEFANSIFDIPPNWVSNEFMQVVAICKYPNDFPAIVHRDGTSRIQTVPNDGSLFRRLLEQWYKKTGCPMLLNTSLNIKGQPIVNNIKDSQDFEHHYGVKVFN